MKILGIDSSGLVATVALVEDDNLIAEYTVNNKKTHSQTLLPMLDAVVASSELDLNSIEAIAIAEGPGSFTGLRIGSATVKGLSLALDKPVVPVPTLEGLAYNMWGNQDLICPIMDARRNQVYTALYRFADGNLICELEQVPMDIDELLDIVAEKNEKVTFVGDGIKIYGSRIAERLNENMYKLAPAHINKQRAGSVAVAGMNRYKNGLYVNGDDFAPVYLRKSQAEREREEKKEKENE
jgi:tRNA threonylcarbamoyladenosine biosynthesis protein TsaB